MDDALLKTCVSHVALAAGGHYMNRLLASNAGHGMENRHDCNCEGDRETSRDSYSTPKVVKVVSESVVTVTTSHLPFVM